MSRTQASPPTLLTLALAVSACGGGDAPLGYGVPSTSQVSYAYGDTTLVGVSAMGQELELSLLGVAAYDVTFGRAADGVAVTLTVRDLAATLNVPMAEPVVIDESAVQGPLVFTLDHTGNATVTATPRVTPEASQVISGLSTAHTFFPGLPGTVVAPGDQWVDTVSYEGDDAGGAERSIITYTAVGDTTVEGRSLLKLTLSGTSQVSNSMTMGDMEVSQSSTVTLEGHVLWDARAGLMFEMVRRGRGQGTVTVPIAPVPLPITVRAVQRARLQVM